MAVMIINEMTTFGNKRSRAPNIGVNKIKGFCRVRITKKIWKLNLFFKLTTLAMKTRLNICDLNNLILLMLIGKSHINGQDMCH
jgi:ribosomal protein L28